MFRLTRLPARARVLVLVSHGALCLACILGIATVASAQPPWENAVNVLQTSFTGPIASTLGRPAVAADTSVGGKAPPTRRRRPGSRQKT